VICCHRHYNLQEEEEERRAAALISGWTEAIQGFLRGFESQIQEAVLLVLHKYFSVKIGNHVCASLRKEVTF